MNLLFNSDIVNLLLKTKVLILLFWSALIKYGKVLRLRRWKGGEVGRWEGGGVGRWEVLRFIQGWGIQSESKISSFCS